VQPLIWKAIVDEDPYPVKALVTWGSNVLLNGGEVKTIYKALKSPNLDLHVVLEHVMTPTAMAGRLRHANGPSALKQAAPRIEFQAQEDVGAELDQSWTSETIRGTGAFRHRHLAAGCALSLSLRRSTWAWTNAFASSPCCGPSR